MVSLRLLSGWSSGWLSGGLSWRGGWGFRGGQLRWIEFQAFGAQQKASFSYHALARVESGVDHRVSAPFPAPAPRVESGVDHRVSVRFRPGAHLPLREDARLVDHDEDHLFRADHLHGAARHADRLLSACRPRLSKIHVTD